MRISTLQPRAISGDIVVHYDPADHVKVALVATDMPLGGSRTPSNLKVLEVWREVSWFC
jgi:hypothetical protein